MKVMISTDGGEHWGEIWDLSEDVTSLLTDRQVYDGSGLRVRYFDIDLSDYAGKDVKLAWRYMRDEGDNAGNSMIVDGIKITHPVSSAIHDVKTATATTNTTISTASRSTASPRRRDCISARVRARPRR